MPERFTADPPERFAFTKCQRDRLGAILKVRKGQETARYLNIVESMILSLRIDVNAFGDYRPAPISDEVDTLKAIANHARGLFRALRRSRKQECHMVLAHEIKRLGVDPDVVPTIENYMPFLMKAATSATSLAPDAQPGRPPDLMEQNFIIELARYYEAIFTRRPPYSRGSTFPKFVAQVLDIAVPGNRHSAANGQAIDNSKIVRAALEAAGMLPKGTARSRRQRSATKRRR